MPNTAANLEVLCFAPHPDDAEIFCGGMLAKFVALGYRVGLVDLTRGELGSQGTVEGRAQEAEAARAVLGLSVRENAGFPDGKIGLPAVVEEQTAEIVRLLRRFRPEIVLAPYPKCRHPDHTAAGELLTRALFFSGVAKYLPESQPAHAPLQTMYYQMRQIFVPGFICDTTEVHAKKMAAVACFKSQVQREDGAGLKTLISSPLMAKAIEARDRHYGAMIGTEFAEAFYLRNAISIADPLEHFRRHPSIGTLEFPESF